MTPDAQENRPLVHVAEFVRLRSYGQLLAYMSMSMGIYRSARDSDGYVAGGIRAKWWTKQFWTYSVWEDRQSMLHFVHTQPHANAMARVLEFAAPGSCYVEWTREGAPDWSEAVERLKLPTAYFVFPAP